MLRRLCNWLYGRSDDKELLLCALREMTKQLGGSVVISLDDLNATGRLEVTQNEAPEGVRLTVIDA